MNDLIDFLYEYILERRYNSIIIHPEYQRRRVMLDQERAHLEETLTAEQKKELCLYMEHTEDLADFSLFYMFRETLSLLRGFLAF